MKVETLVHDLVNDTKHTSNSFYFTFATDCDEKLPIIKPVTYCDAMDYIDGQRRLENSLQAAKNQGTTLEHHYH